MVKCNQIVSKTCSYWFYNLEFQGQYSLHEIAVRKRVVLSSMFRMRTKLTLFLSGLFSWSFFSCIYSTWLHYDVKHSKILLFKHLLKLFGFSRYLLLVYYWLMTFELTFILKVCSPNVDWERKCRNQTTLLPCLEMFKSNRYINTILRICKWKEATLYFSFYIKVAPRVENTVVFKKG